MSSNGCGATTQKGAGSMKVISLMFVSTLAAIPAVGSITPEGAFTAMSIGNAQTILSMVAVIEFLAIGFMFSIWRRDVAAERKSDKANSDMLIKLATDTSVALSENAAASHRQSAAIEDFDKSVSGFAVSVAENTKVIERCTRLQP
jgi:hypothetical protein